MKREVRDLSESVIGPPAHPLRPFAAHDIPEIVRDLDDYEVWKTSGDVPFPFTYEDAVRYVETALDPLAPPAFAIDLDGKWAGGIHLVQGEDVRRASANIPLWLGREAWGKGLATAALKSIVEWGFLNFPDIHRIWGEPMAHNLACIRALEKAGFRREAVLRSSQIKAGVVYDSVLLSICRNSIAPAGLLRRDDIAPPISSLPSSKLFSSLPVPSPELRLQAKRRGKRSELDY